MVSAIFIKHVLPESPAALTGGLYTGDRVLQIDGTSLTGRDHRAAVEAIRAAGKEVTFVVQSLSEKADRKVRAKNESPGEGYRQGSIILAELFYP